MLTNADKEILNTFVRSISLEQREQLQMELDDLIEEDDIEKDIFYGEEDLPMDDPFDSKW